MASPAPVRQPHWSVHVIALALGVAGLFLFSYIASAHTDDLRTEAVIGFKS